MGGREGGWAMKCEFSGCKNPATWTAHKLWGKGGTLCTCDKHRPGSRPRPESLKHLPSFYRIEPMVEAKR
jgi:hypothetical protein